MTRRKTIPSIAAAALAALLLTAAPVASAEDTAPPEEPAHITPTEDPHGAEWGQPGDPLPEGMKEIDHERQQAELEAESPQQVPAPEVAPATTAPATEVAPATSAPATSQAQKPAPQRQRPAPSLPSTGA